MDAGDSNRRSFYRPALRSFVYLLTSNILKFLLEYHRKIHSSTIFGLIVQRLTSRDEPIDSNWSSSDLYMTLLEFVARITDISRLSLDNRG